MKKQGFTLVEIMIVVAIIGLLAAIAIPSFVKSRNAARASACVNNLRQIDSAKEQFAMANSSAGTATPTWANVMEYIRGTQPACPASGTYTLGTFDTQPSCSVGGEHAL